MKLKLSTLCLAMLLLAVRMPAQEWTPAGDRIKTRWAAEVSPANVHKEYPRPQMVRPEWKSLNGLWDYAITPRSSSKPASFDGKILVPFAVESSLSGVGRTLTPEDALWYRTELRSEVVPPVLEFISHTLLHAAMHDVREQDDLFL